MTPKRATTDASGNPVVRVLGGYLASVAAAVTAFMLSGAAVALFVPAPPPVAEPTLPSDWISVAITLVMAMLVVTLAALPAFLLCLAASVRAGWRRPVIHVACGAAMGFGLGRLFAGVVDRPVQTASAGAVGGGVYWWLAVRERRRSGSDAAKIGPDDVS